MEDVYVLHRLLVQNAEESKSANPDNLDGFVAAGRIALIEILNIQAVLRRAGDQPKVMARPQMARDDNGHTVCQGSTVTTVRGPHTEAVMAISAILQKVHNRFPAYWKAMVPQGVEALQREVGLTASSPKG